MMRLICLPAAAVATAAPMNDGLARTPPMGWNSWEAFRLNIDESTIRSMADAMVSTGMKVTEQSNGPATTRGF